MIVDMNNRQYRFSAEAAFDVIKKHWTSWDDRVKPNCYVVGISGGIDSTCVAALACKIFSKERVVGVSLPCDGQSDIADVNLVFKHLGIRRIDIDIGDMFNNALQHLDNQCIEVTDVCKTNMPARLRMTMLYGVAQCLNGIVVNTCNRSESIVGNDTLFGDDCGSYAPIQSLTKAEVRKIATLLGVPEELVEKTPIDGLQPLTDEERLGITYEEIDNYIRGIDGGIAAIAIVVDKFTKNKFKLEMVHIDGPDFSFLHDEIREEFGL